MAIGPELTDVMAQLNQNNTNQRRFHRFSLRTLLISVTVGSCLIGWYVAQSQNQRACVGVIVENGGRVIYAHSYRTGKFDANANPPGPKWLRDWLGLDYFDHVHGIDFSKQDIAGLPDLSAVSEIKTLWLRNTNLDDLTVVSHLTELENLWIGETQVHDLSPLSRNKKLKWLSLERTNVQDLSPLNGLADLRTLNISGTKISAESLKQFRELNPNCSILGEAD